MATAMLALDWDLEDEVEQEPSPPASGPDETLQGSARLLKAKRDELDAEIERAKTLFGEPEIAQEIYSEETLERAVTFLTTHIEGLWNSYSLIAPIPSIGPGPAGSVDLYWERPSSKLLVNIPADRGTLATFYADDHGRQKVKGSVDPEKFSVSIAACMVA